MAAEVALVPGHGRSCGSGGVIAGGVLAVCQLVRTGGEVSICSPSPDAPSISFLVHECVSGQLGSASMGPDSSGDVDGGRTRSPYQCFEDEGSAASLGYLQGSGHGGACGLDEPQRHCGSIHQETGGAVCLT